VETAGVPSASAAFVRFAIAAASAVPLIDFKQTEVLLAGKKEETEFFLHVRDRRTTYVTRNVYLPQHKGRS